MSHFSNLINQHFNQFLLDQGIHHRVCFPYTSQQSKIVEKKHCRVIEIDLTLVSQASLSLRFQDDAFATVVDIINRLPTPVLHD